MATKKKYNTVRELLNSEQRWIKYTMAATKKPDDLLACPPFENRVKPRNKKAVCFCLLGACQRVYPTGGLRQEAVKRIVEAVRDLFPDFPHGTITGLTHFNDSHATTHKHIKAVLRKANV